MAWDTIADETKIEKTARALRANGFNAITAENGKEALGKLLAQIPAGSEVLTVTSTTLDQIGATAEINESGKYDSVKKRFADISDKKDRLKARKAGTVVQYATGSVHAVTEDGVLVIASASGSQIAPYAYTADNLVLVAGAQKIVRDIGSALRRIREYSVPLEQERMMKAYGTGTSLNEILIYNRERPGRVTVILVREKLGF